jgi:hypothetical protein
MSVSRRCAEERNVERRFERAAARNDLSENSANGLSRQRTAIQPADAIQHFSFTVRSVNLLIASAFEMANPLREGSPII